MQNFKNIKKLGIMGGTFNPVHYAHLLSSSYAFERYNLDKVVFIPTGEPPHKKNINIASGQDRYNMLNLAIQDNPNFFISSIEIDRHTTTYTIDTLRQIKSMCDENVELYFITGTDTINQVYNWKDTEEIFNLCRFIVTTRPKYILDENTKNLINKYKDKIYFCETPMLEISSSNIRKRIEQEKTITYLLPKNVEEYIYKNSLYKTDFLKKYEKQINILKQNLNEKRFYHSIQVAKEAKSLAIEHNEDKEKAFLAGLVHDCCKCFSLPKIYEACEKYNFKLDEVLKKQPDLAHSFLGYYVAKDIYNIKDENILNSIKYHTTGKKNMSNLEKIIYIADYIEPTRPYFEGIYKARELAYKDLDKAMAYILENTIQFNLKKGRIIHHLSMEAYDYYKN
ncbi:nicotinate-nucleotide adenylyltransferase [[Clostridium] colinum]|uniref:nicotinate-nucleotide adenylyltransferase n=1 Tax=[Clostridium] colinum TaxID=36835 RepID=UPI0020243D8F|nr:nicotinate-nucleotide adenylyltransferase [[Clostridium] colinum]